MLHASAGSDRPPKPPVACVYDLDYNYTATVTETIDYSNVITEAIESCFDDATSTFCPDRCSDLLTRGVILRSISSHELNRLSKLRLCWRNIYFLFKVVSLKWLSTVFD